MAGCTPVIWACWMPTVISAFAVAGTTWWFAAGRTSIRWKSRMCSLAHPGVAAVGVVGVPDRRLGESLAAFIVPIDPAHPPRPEELASFTRITLAGFKIPQYWYMVAELPLNSAGKVVRAATSGFTPGAPAQ